MLSYRVVYEDGTEKDNIRYDLIDRQKIRKFILLNEVKYPILTLHTTPEMRLIWRIRTDIGFDGKVKGRGYLVGWQETRNGANFQTLFVVSEDGSIEIANGFRPEIFLQPVVLRSEERP